MECRRCKEDKTENEFYPNNRVCKTCRCKQTKEWRLNNKERYKKTKKLWKKNNPEKVKAEKRRNQITYMTLKLTLIMEIRNSYTFRKFG